MDRRAPIASGGLRAGAPERAGPEDAAAPAPGVQWLYLPPAALLAIWTLRLAAADRPSSFLDLVNLAFHEAGHVFFSPFGQTLHVLGGTLLQLLVPALLAGYFLFRRGPCSAAACLWWLGQNLVNVSIYMADAREMKLPLVGGGEHDWTQIFYQFGLLGEESVRAVSTITHHLGVLAMLGSAAAIAAYGLFPRFRVAVDARLSALPGAPSDRTS
jgi:hypothetical protein